MKSSFQKRIKRQSKSLCHNANAKFRGHVLEKSSSLICTYTRIYISVLESSLPKTQSLNLALALQADFLEWRLEHFGKALFACVLH